MPLEFKDPNTGDPVHITNNAQKVKTVCSGGEFYCTPRPIVIAQEPAQLSVQEIAIACPGLVQSESDGTPGCQFPGQRCKFTTR